jgi:hypothetical protein
MRRVSGNMHISYHILNVIDYYLNYGRHSLVTESPIRKSVTRLQNKPLLSNVNLT